MSPPPFHVESTPLVPGVTLIEASAGTGKTFTLVGLYLRLLLEQGLTVDQILVVTFTEAATAELRGRIRERLTEARAALRAESGTDQRARRARLEAALEQFDEAAVFTIHGFCQRVLKERAFESRALFDAELTPEVTPLLREVADNFWRRNFYLAPVRRVLFAAQARISAESLFRLLKEHTRQADVEVLARAAERPWRVVVEEAESVLAEAAALWQSERSTIRSHFGDVGGAWANQPYNQSARMQPLFDSLDALFGGDDPPADALSSVVQFGQSVLAGKRNLRRKAPVPEHPFFAICDRLSGALQVFAARTRMEFLRDAPRELARLKERDRQFGFADQLSQVDAALAGPAGPGLAAALRHRYRAALIDEFQDTDPQQWRIFGRLFGDGSTFLHLVGDPKQAIYSFRGADVFAYLQARRRADREFTLGGNWRSERRLVEAVNQLFSSNPLPFALPGIQFHPVAARGSADETPLFDQGERLPPLTVWFWDAEAEGVTTVNPQRDRLAESVATEIVRLLSGAARLGERRLEPGEVAVLVDRHDQAERVAAALSRRGVPSVQRTQQSVFGTTEAREVHALLEALIDGARDDRRRAALITDLIGLSARELAELRTEESRWVLWLGTLSRWSRDWQQNGFLLMLETVLRECQTRSRLLATADGERRVTNLLHLGELLQHAAAQHRLTPGGLAHWLAIQRGRAEGDETAPRETLLRLERDAAAVQLVTLHSSKGLEYPVVFCPFLTGRSRPEEPTVLFHDPTDGLALKHDVGSPLLDAHERRRQGEILAENLRLLYVALTRAQHRCYVGWGKLKGSESAALSWLVHAPPGVGALSLEEAPEVLEDWVKERDASQRRADLAALDGEAIAITDLPPPDDTRWIPIATPAAPRGARPFRGRIQRDWGMTSFSSLAHGRTGEGPEREPAAPTSEATVEPVTLAGFRGTRAGTCLHAIFERLDFPQAEGGTVRKLVAEELSSHGFSRAGLEAELEGLVTRVLEAEVIPGARLRDIPASSCWRELEFVLPVQRLTPAGLHAAFAAVPHGPLGDALVVSLSRLGFADVEGFLGGFMDLVLVHDERWWLIDWKSNWLGDDPDDYTAEALNREMLSQHYPLQYHLYLLALHRLLQSRLPDYDYERHLGGVCYVFVRGVTAERPGLGLYRDRPPRVVIEELDRRLLRHPEGEERTG